MPEPSLLRATKIIAALAMFAAASAACGQVYKCTDGSGKTTYSDAPCDAAAKPLSLPPDTKGNSTNPSMCAQLLDETRRLDADAERDIKRGKTETAEHLKQRQTMAKRYSERCVGVARAGAAAK